MKLWSNERALARLLASSSGTCQVNISGGGGGGGRIECLLLALLGARLAPRRDSARSLNRASVESDRCATIAHVVAVIKQPMR